MSELAIETTQSSPEIAVDTPVQEVTQTEQPVAVETPAVQEAAAPERNLLDLAESPKEAAPEADWWLDKDTPGTGDKPEWFDDSKYDTLAEQAKAHPELRKLLSNFTGAPDEYEFNIDPILELGDDAQMDLEDPMLKGFLGWAKEANLSQDGFDSILNMYLLKEQGMAKDFKTTMDNFSQEQFEMLNDEERGQLTTLKQWGKNNLAPELFEEFVDMAETAGSIRVLLSLKNNFMPTKVPTDMPVAKQFTRPELREMQKDPRSLTDPDYQNMLKKAYQSSV